MLPQEADMAPPTEPPASMKSGRRYHVSDAIVLAVLSR